MKNLTLAQLKRDVQSRSIRFELIKRYNDKVLNPVICEISKVQTNGFYLRREKGDSFLEYPPASLVEYTDTTLKIFEAGKRPLNELEQSVMDKWMQIEQTKDYKDRAYVDMITDGSSTYYEKERFFAISPCPYLFHSKNGLRYVYNENKVVDPKIKGKCVLEYKIHRI